MKIGTRGEWISLSVFVSLIALCFGLSFYHDCAVEAELNEVATLAPKYGMSEESFKEYAHVSGDFPRLDSNTVDDLREYIREAKHVLND